jgi:hypothetical protein
VGGKGGGKEGGREGGKEGGREGGRELGHDKRTHLKWQIFNEMEEGRLGMKGVLLGNSKEEGRLCGERAGLLHLHVHVICTETDAHSQ